MTVRFHDYATDDTADATYVRVDYWQGDLNAWRVTRRGGIVAAVVDILNVSDWRGLTHTNVPMTAVEIIDRATALDAMAAGLKQARRDHANAMRRTLAARRDGTADGRAAGGWVIDGNTTTEQARATLDALDDGTYWSLAEMNYPQTYAGDLDDSEKWDAYTAAYDDAYAAEITRAARYILGHDVFGHANA